MSNQIEERKRIYLIRHGETAKNHGYLHQSPEEPLTERGQSQVRNLIEFLREEKIDTLISSNYRRARETADMIASELGLTYSIEPSVREFGRPYSIYDRHHLSLPSLRYFFDLYRHRLNLLWDDEGAENIVHIRERVRDARRMLEDLPGERIAVISHRIFMTMFVETVCYDRPLSLLRFILGLVGRKRIPNTGILLMTCDHNDSEFDNVCTWHLEETLLPPYNRNRTKT